MGDNDTRLIEYALGVLNEESRIELERDLDAQHGLRAELSDVLGVLAQFDEEQTPMHPSPALRERLFKSLDAETRFEGFIQRLSGFYDLGVDRMRQVLAKVAGFPDEPWVPSGIAGVHLLHFDGGERVAEADCGLVYLEPGSGFPVHRHLGDEWAMLLQGQIVEDSGLSFQAGDISYRAAGSTHAFRVVGDEAVVSAVVLHKGFEILQTD